MDIESIIEYAAGFVGATGGKVELRTRDIDRAIEWTRSNTSPCELAVCKGLTLDDCNCQEQDRGYIAEHLNENIIAYEGEYTREFIRELGVVYGN